MSLTNKFLFALSFVFLSFCGCKSDIDLNRKLFQIKLHFANRINFPSNFGLLNIYNDRLFCFDYNENSVVELDTNGKVLKKFGIENPTHKYYSVIGLWVNQNGIFTFDAATRKIVGRTFQDSVFMEYVNENLTLRACFSNVGSDVIFNLMNTKEMTHEKYESLDLSTQEKRIFDINLNENYQGGQLDGPIIYKL